jgi:hypothetical protein
VRLDVILSTSHDASGGADRIGSMVWLFLIALVIVAPYGLVRVRRVLRDRDEGRPPTPPDAEAIDATTRVGARDLETVLAALDGAVEAGSEEFELVVPAEPTVGGRQASPELVAALLGDAARRAGVEVVPAGPSGGGTRWRFRRT